MSTFNDPEIVQFLKTHFIPVAINRDDDRDDLSDRREQEFFRKMTLPGPRDEGGKPLQGMYISAPDGTPLGCTYDKKGRMEGWTIERYRALLKKALNDFKPGNVDVIEPDKSFSRIAIKPPKGGLVVNVYAKVLGSYTKADYKESPNYVLEAMKEYQSSIGRDHLWVWKDEHEALVRGVLPEGLMRRIARCHLDDSSVGGFVGWQPREIKKAEIRFGEGRLSGSILLETGDGKRGYDAKLLGFVEAKEGKITRFDVVVKGLHWGSTDNTRGAPDGKHPLAIAFSLCPGMEEADQIPPAMIHEDGYRR